jgi:hypothetical protein
MSLIGTDDVVAAIRKVSAMSLAQKEALADEIHQRQPHMLASCLVQSGLGAKPAAHEFLLHVLLVCYQSMKESGLQWPVITEDDQDRQMQRWVGAVQFSEDSGRSVAERAREQYIRRHPEQWLLAFVLSETDRWRRRVSERHEETESDKFVMMAAVNLVNCIAAAAATSPING